MIVKLRVLVVLTIHLSSALSLIVNSSCSRQLGMESGKIEDYQIIASSSSSSEVGPAKVSGFRTYSHILIIPRASLYRVNVFICKVRPSLFAHRQHRTPETGKFCSLGIKTEEIKKA